MERSVTVITRLVQKELKALCKTSQRVAHAVRRALQQVQDRPESYRTLAIESEQIAGREGVFLRVVDITHQAHDYRLVYLHQERGDGNARVHFLFVFPRRQGYPQIDWGAIEALLAEGPPAE